MSFVYGNELPFNKFSRGGEGDYPVACILVGGIGKSTQTYNNGASGNLQFGEAQYDPYHLSNAALGGANQYYEFIRIPYRGIWDLKLHLKANNGGAQQTYSLIFYINRAGTLIQMGIDTETLIAGGLSTLTCHSVQLLQAGDIIYAGFAVGAGGGAVTSNGTNADMQMSAILSYQL